MTTLIKSSEFNSALFGFEMTLNDGRIVQVQFNKEQNRLDADYGSYFPVIDKENEYGLNLSEEEENEINEYLRLNAVEMACNAGLIES